MILQPNNRLYHWVRPPLNLILLTLLSYDPVPKCPCTFMTPEPGNHPHHGGCALLGAGHTNIRPLFINLGTQLLCKVDTAR